MCHECIHMTGSGCGNKLRCTSRASGRTPLSNFLNPPLLPTLILYILHVNTYYNTYFLLHTYMHTELKSKNTLLQVHGQMAYLVLSTECSWVHEADLQFLHSQGARPHLQVMVTLLSPTDSTEPTHINGYRGAFLIQSS